MAKRRNVYDVISLSNSTIEKKKRRKNHDRKQKGKRVEKRCREILEADGYFVVESRGSRGPVDLVAIATKRVQPIELLDERLQKVVYRWPSGRKQDWSFTRLIQVKNNQGVRTHAIHKLRALKETLVGPVSVEAWRLKDYARTPDILFF